MGSVKRRHVDGKAVGKWRAEARGPLGQRKTRTFDTRGEGLEWVSQTEADLRRGTWRDPDAGAVTFAAWSTGWLETRGTLKPSAKVREASIVRVHLVPVLGTTRLDAIKPSMVARMVTLLLEAGKAPKTVRNVHAVLYGVMEAALVDGLITVNPCKGTRLPRNKRTRPPRFLTEQELTHLISVVPDYWRPLVLMLAGTGMRWGEAVGLKVRYVDVLERKLRVAETLNEAEGRLKWGTPKTDASERSIDLPAAVVDALLPLVAGRGGDEPVFLGRDGALIRHRNFNTRVWHKACKAAGLSLPMPTIHDLRHSHAALLISRNVPGGLHTIKERFGHESITTTSNIYGHLLPTARAGVVSALDEVFGQGAEGPVLGAPPTTAPPQTEDAGQK